MTTKTEPHSSDPDASAGQVRIRPATVDDASTIAELMDLAGDGIPRLLWYHYAPQGADLMAYGAERAASGSGNYSWRNAHLLQHGKQTAGMVLAYRLPEASPDLANLHPLERSLVALESQAAGSYYVNALAVYPHWQGKGYGRFLMQHAHRLADKERCRRASLIVFSENTPARNLYESMGYRLLSSGPPLDVPGLQELGDCLLLVRDGGSAQH